MVNATRTLPLTPTMRAALAGRTANMLRRTLPWGGVTAVICAGTFALLTASSLSWAWLIVGAPLLCAGLLFTFAGIYAARLKQQAALALSSGTYTRFDGAFAVAITTVDLSPATHDVIIDGKRYPFDPFGAPSVADLEAATAGTVLAVPTTGHLFAVWGEDGARLYTAPGYLLDRDAEVSHPASATSPGVSQDVPAEPGRWARLADRLAINPGIAILTGTVMLIFGGLAGLAWLINS